MKEDEFKKQFGSEFDSSPRNVEEKAHPSLPSQREIHVKDDYYKLIKFALFGLGIFCVVFLYLMYEGDKQDGTEINPYQNISIQKCPEIPENVPCPNPVPCPPCPSPTCHNICECPGEINITIQNYTV